MRLLGARSLLSLSAVIWFTACTPQPPDGNTNQNSANANTNQNSGSVNGNANTGGNPTGQFLLRVEVETAAGVTQTARVIVLVNNVVTRADDSFLTFDRQVLNGAPFQGTFSTTDDITLISDDLYKPGAIFNSVPDPTTLPGFLSPPQFDSWDGATPGEIGVDRGTLNLRLTGDRTIKARFKSQNLLSVRYNDPRNGGGTLMNFSSDTRPLTIPPEEPRASTGINIVGRNMQQTDLGIYGFFPDGSTVTMEIPSPFPFTSWMGGSPAGRIVTVTLNRREDLVLTW